VYYIRVSTTLGLIELLIFLCTPDMIQQKEDNCMLYRNEGGSLSGMTSKQSGTVEQDLQNALKMRGRLIRRKNQEIFRLQQQLTELSEKLTERERTIETLCTKYLYLILQKDTQVCLI